MAVLADHDVFSTKDAVADDIVAAIPSPDERNGYTIVPVNPTDAMIDAALMATAAHLDIKGSQLTVNREKMRVRWRAMLRANGQVTTKDGP